MNKNKKATLRGVASLNNSVSNCSRIYPPYGKKIDEIRKQGLAPAKRVIVSTRWEIGKAYPRIIVTGEIPIQNFEFKYLAGLSVQIVHFNSDDFIDELVDAIKSVRPKNLYSFNMDSVKAGLPAFKIIQPHHIKGDDYVF